MLSIISPIELDFCASDDTPSDATLVDSIFSLNFLDNPSMAAIPPELAIHIRIGSSSKVTHGATACIRSNRKGCHTGIDRIELIVLDFIISKSREGKEES